MTDAAEQHLVNRTGLAVMLGCSRKKTYRMASVDESFPRPLKDPCGTTMWRRSDVLAYIDQLWERANAQPE